MDSSPSAPHAAPQAGRVPADEILLRQTLRADGELTEHIGRSMCSWGEEPA